MGYASSARRTWSAVRSHSENTATGEMSISRQARMIRTAISPRFAMRSFFTTEPSNPQILKSSDPQIQVSQRDIPVFLRGVLVALVLEVAQRGDQLAPRFVRTNHFVDEPSPRGDIGVGELLAELGDLLGSHRRRIRGLIELALIENVDGAVWPHYREFRGRPRVVEVGSQMLARHHAVGPAVRLAGNDRHLRHGRLGKREEQFGAVLDDPAELLHGSRQKTRHVLEGDERNVERVAETDETRALH